MLNCLWRVRVFICSVNSWFWFWFIYTHIFTFMYLCMWLWHSSSYLEEMKFGSLLRGQWLFLWRIDFYVSVILFMVEAVERWVL
jgi:hypothetical protein